MSPIHLFLIEGECIQFISVAGKRLYLGTNLGRIFRSTDAPPEFADFIEIPEEVETV